MLHFASIGNDVKCGADLSLSNFQARCHFQETISCRILYYTKWHFVNNATQLCICSINYINRDKTTNLYS